MISTERNRATGNDTPDKEDSEMSQTEKEEKNIEKPVCKNTEIFPKWPDMPKSVPMIELSWEDIYENAKDITQDRFKRNPTKEEIKELFNIIEHKGLDAESGTFWATISVRCSTYYDGIEC